MKIKTLLIFPPGWVPYAPYLSLPILKGFLEKHSVNADIKDVNLEFYDYILSHTFISKAYKLCEDKLRMLDTKTTHTVKEKDSYYKFSKAILLKKTIERIREAKEIIRSDKFYDNKLLKMAKNVLLDALYIIDTAYEEFSINLNDIAYTHPVNSSKELLAMLDDKLSNIFIEYYETNLLRHINSNKYNLIGISVTVQAQLKSAVTLARLIKKRCPNVKNIVFGGNYATRLVINWTEAHPFFLIFDFLICYEGENGLLSLIKSLEEEKDLAGVPNLCYVKENKLVKNDLSQVDIDDIAIPNFDGFPLEKYFMPELILPLFTSRCCYSKCTFCTIPSATYGKYRTIKIEKVYQTMIILSKKYAVNYFTFVDETFAPFRMKQLAEIIILGNKNYYWYCETRFEKGLSETFFNTLYAGGCRKIQFGLESYNQRILNLMKKNINISNIKPSLENCLKAGIPFHVFFMIGFPTETEAESKRTLDFTKNMLDSSYFKYNNHNSTRGYTTFSLEKHSYIYNHPEEFFIEIINPNKKDDLSRTCNYISSKGLSPNEARHIVNLYNKNLSVIYKGEKNYHLLNKIFASEEEHFLKHARNLKQINTKKQKVVKSRPALDDCPSDSPLFFNKSTSFYLFKYNPINDDLYYNPIITLYNLNTRAYYQLDATYIDILKKITKGSLLIKEALCYGNPIKKILADLLYYDFLNLQCKLPHAFLRYFDTVLVLDENIIKVADIENHIYLLNTITGKFMKINKFSLLLLQLLNGSSSLKEILNVLRKENIKIDLEKYKRLINEALSKQMVYIKNRGLKLSTD